LTLFAKITVHTQRHGLVELEDSDGKITDVAADMADEHRERRPNDGVDDQPHEQLLLRRRAAGYEPASQRIRIDMTPHQMIRNDNQSLISKTHLS